MICTENSRREGVPKHNDVVEELARILHDGFHDDPAYDSEPHPVKGVCFYNERSDKGKRPWRKDAKRIIAFIRSR